jgi:Ca2+-transporting ATPase
MKTTMSTATDNEFHSQSPEDVAAQLRTDPDAGLTAAEATRRLTEHGPNELPEQPATPFWRRVLDQLRDFVVLLLIAAAVVSFALGDTAEAAAIMAIVVLNAVIGVVQEGRAEASLAALKKLAAPEARVIREGQRMAVPARELVPGDVVLLEAGNYVPADMRLIESVNLRVEEAALTGESVPTEKRAALLLEPGASLGDRKNTAFSGTLVAYGRGAGIVTSTGLNTQIGLIAQMLSAVEEEETPLQKRLDGLGRQLSIAALVVVVIVFVVGILRGADWLEELIIAISLAIAAVPEGLPAVVTITLALGMREMVRRHALIRRLASVETLGSASVICSDKTGTLTQNAMTATRVWLDEATFEITGDGYQPAGRFLHQGDHLDFSKHPAVLTAMWAAALANDARLEPSGEESGQPTWRMVGDPTEGALMVAAGKAGIWRDTLEPAFPRVAENPFDSARKTMSTVHAVNTPLPEYSPFNPPKAPPPFTLCVKGAPDVVLSHCRHYQSLEDEVQDLTPVMREQITTANSQFASEALRVLAVAYRPLSAVPEVVTADGLEQDLVFLGLIGMIDPPRAEVRPALEHARQAGIRTVMITGDYPDTAKAIAQSIGLLRPGGKVLPGAALDKMNDSQLAAAVQETDVFARVSPEHKVKIVEALQRGGAVVAMTGDGVNDAPAVKRADIGVAMGITGTDVAKGAADMVLTDDNYASIVAAVEQGRIIYANIRKFVFFLLSSNVAEIMIIFLATLAGLPVPLTAIQLLWLNLITDGAPALALAMEKGDPDVMRQPPRPKAEPIVNGPMRIGIVVQTIAQTTATLTALVLGLWWGLQSAGLAPAGADALSFVLGFDFRALGSVAYEEVVRTGETMAFVTLSLAELFRAYTVRSERASLFQIGVFSNRYMQYAVGLSLVLLLLVVNVPFLQPFFNTHVLTPVEWATVVGLALIPAVSEEVTKFFLRRGAS